MPGIILAQQRLRPLTPFASSLSACFRVTTAFARERRMLCRDDLCAAACFAMTIACFAETTACFTMTMRVIYSDDACWIWPGNRPIACFRVTIRVLCHDDPRALP